MAGATLARRATNDAYNYAKKQLQSKRSVHTDHNARANRFGRSYNSFRDVLYALKYTLNESSGSGLVTGESNSCKILHATGIAQASSIQNRSRQLIWVKAVKFNLFLRNNTSQPMYYRYALLQWIHKEGGVALATNHTKDIFRADGAAADTTRFKDFLNVPGPLRKQQAGFNREKYRVLCDGYGTLGHNNTGTTYFEEINNSYTSIKRQIKVDRRVEYDGTGALNCRNPIILVYWATKAEDFSSTVGPATDFTHFANTVCMFQE